MSLDLNQLSIAQLKAELKQKGLETTGKKTELVTRLKEAIEAGGGDDVENEEEEMQEELKPKVDDEEQAAAPKRSKRWLHVLANRKYNSKIKHLECVQKMSQKRKKRDVLAATNDLRVRAYPITLEDLSSPTIANIMELCSSSVVNFFQSSSADGEKELVGMIQLTFVRKCDIADSVENLRLYKDDFNIFHMGGDKKYHDYLEEWRGRYTGSSEPQDKTMMICPIIPDEMTEEELCRLFSRASEIYIMDKRKATITYAGEEVEQDQPRFAYVQFPNEAMSRKNIEELQEVEPTPEMRKMCLIPFLKLIEGKEDADKKEEKKEDNVKTEVAKPQTQKTTPTVNQKSKRGPGVVSTVRGMPNQRSYAMNVGRSQKSSVNRSAGHHMMGQRPYGGSQRAMAPDIIGRLQAEAAMRGPEEAHGMRMLGSMLNSMDQSTTHRGWQDQATPRRGWQDQSTQGGWQDEGPWASPLNNSPAAKRTISPSVPSGGPMEKRNRTGTSYGSHDYDGYDAEDTYDGLMSQIVSVTRQLNEVMGKGNGIGGSSVGGIGRGISRGRGRGMQSPGVGYGSRDISYGGEGYGNPMGYNHRY